MGRSGLGAAAVASLLLSLATAHAAAVKVTIDNVPETRGNVHVDLCRQATFLTPNCTINVEVKARRGRMVVMVPNVPPGRYAAVAYHDANSNGELDTNALGMPLEFFGFSNNPPLLMGPPDFKDAAFDVANKDVSVWVPLRR